MGPLINYTRDKRSWEQPELTIGYSRLRYTGLRGLLRRPCGLCGPRGLRALRGLRGYVGFCGLHGLRGLRVLLRSIRGLRFSVCHNLVCLLRFMIRTDQSTYDKHTCRIAQLKSDAARSARRKLGSLPVTLNNRRC